MLKEVLRGSNLKVSKSRKQFKVSSILPKNEQKQFYLRYHSSKVQFFCSFCGRIEETIDCFRDLLTFSGIKQNCFHNNFKHKTRKSFDSYLVIIQFGLIEEIPRLLYIFKKQIFKSNNCKSHKDHDAIIMFQTQILKL